MKHRGYVASNVWPCLMRFPCHMVFVPQYLHTITVLSTNLFPSLYLKRKPKCSTTHCALLFFFHKSIRRSRVCRTEDIDPNGSWIQIWWQIFHVRWACTAMGQQHKSCLWATSFFLKVRLHGRINAPSVKTLNYSMPQRFNAHKTDFITSTWIFNDIRYWRKGYLQRSCNYGDKLTFNVFTLCYMPFDCLY